MNTSEKIGARSAQPLPLVSPPTAGATRAGGDDDELFWESHVAARMGIARKKISALRSAHLAEGADFGWRGNAVVFTAAGLARLEGLLASNAAPTPGDPAPVGVQTPAGLSPALESSALGECRPERAKFVVVRTVPNPHLIFARRADYAKEAPAVLVRVKENILFHPKLAAFECQRGADGQWRYLGRLPRSLGRW